MQKVETYQMAKMYILPEQPRPFLFFSLLNPIQPTKIKRPRRKIISLPFAFNEKVVG